MASPSHMPGAIAPISAVSASAPMRRPLGFSLLEMMVAVALLSTGLVLLLQVQARSIQLAQDAREMTVATMLVRGKLLDCQTELLKAGFSIGDFDRDGNFDDEGYPTFFWECHAYKPDMPVADVGDVQAAMSGVGAADTAEAAQAQGAELGMQFLAPVMSQMSSILGDSIRELVVLVRWGEGGDVQEMTVTTHVIDKQPVTAVAAMIGQQTDAMRRATGGAGGAGGAADGSGAGRSRGGASGRPSMLNPAATGGVN